MQIRTRRMKQGPERAGPPLALEILGYLLSHPEAKDTVTGIVQWWLTEQRVRRTPADVKRAMRALVAQGLVMEQRLLDGRVYYCLKVPSPAKNRNGSKNKWSK